MKDFKFGRYIIEELPDTFDKMQKDLLLDNIKRVEQALEEFFQEKFGVTTKDIKDLNSRVNNLKFKHLDKYCYPDQDVYSYKGIGILNVYKVPLEWQIKKYWSKGGKLQ